jgi:hypothetical protein
MTTPIAPRSSSCAITCVIVGDVPWSDFSVIYSLRGWWEAELTSALSLCSIQTPTQLAAVATMAQPTDKQDS